MDAIVYDKVGKEAEKVRGALYGIYPQATITDAAIASFDDGVDGIPVKALTVGVEPVQDLHGYDNPWPAGGNVNLLDADGYSLTTEAGTDKTAIIDKLVYLEAGAAYTFSCRQVANAGTATRNLLGVVKNGETVSLVWESSNNPAAHMHQVSYTPSESGYYSPLYWAHTLGTAVTLDQFQVEKGSAFTTYSPYSNICPISGWTGAEICGAGKNLLSYSIGKMTDNPIDVTLNKTRAVFLKAGQTYTLSFDMQNATSWRISIVGFDTTGARLWKDETTRLYGSEFTANSSGKYFVWGDNSSNKAATIVPIYDSYAMLFFSMGDTSASTVMTDQMLELGSTATDYEPYTGSQLSVTFPSSAGTVYGGTLTLNPDRTGTLVVDERYLLADGVNVNCTGGYAGATERLPAIDISNEKGNVTNNAKTKASYLKYENVTESVRNSLKLFSDGSFIALHINDIQGYGTGTPYATDAELRAAANAYLQENNLQIVYPLANPVTYQLTATEISAILTTLYGTNNIWADTGNIEELTYRADLGKYIDSHITTAVANALNA